MFDSRYHIYTPTSNPSDKQRCPSWTDRILWKSDHPVNCLHYSSHPIYVMSIFPWFLSLTTGDHKPVSAFFDVTLEIIVPERFKEIHNIVMRELDRLENEARPIVELSDDQLQFGKIAYLEPRTRSVTIKNKGAVFPPLSSWRFPDIREWHTLTSRN